MTSLAPSPQFHLDNTLGAAYIGNIIAAIFYGITNVQTYLYYAHNPQDRMWLRGSVAFLWALDGLHLAFISHGIYFYSVSNYANPVVMLSPPWSMMAAVALTGVSDSVVRGIYAYRVWRLGGKAWLTIAIIIVSVCVFVGSLGFTIRVIQVGTFANFTQISWILYTSFALVVVADSMIAASMCYFLSERRTGFKRTDSLVRMLMLYSINAGTLTSVCALLCLIAYATMPGNFIFIAFYFMLPKLFLNSLLATLNARQSLRETSSGAGNLQVSIPLSCSTRRSATRSDFSSPGRDQNLEIQIETTIDRKTDSVDDISNSQETSWKSGYSSSAQPNFMAV